MRYAPRDPRYYPRGTLGPLICLWTSKITKTALRENQKATTLQRNAVECKDASVAPSYTGERIVIECNEHGEDWYSGKVNTKDMIELQNA